MSFDPDAYLATPTDTAVADQSTGGFDPDAYLNSPPAGGGFDPDAYLATPAAEPPRRSWIDRTFMSEAEYQKRLAAGELPPESGLGREVNRLVGGVIQGVPGDVAEAVGSQPFQQTVIPAVQRNAAPMAAAFMSGGVSLIPQLGFVASSAVLGDTAAQQQEIAAGVRQEFSPREAIAAGVTAPLFVASPVKPGNVAAGIVQGAAEGAAFTAGSEAIGGRDVSTDDYLVSALLGAGFRGFEAAGARAQTLDALTARARSLGYEGPASFEEIRSWYKAANARPVGAPGESVVDLEVLHDAPDVVPDTALPAGDRAPLALQAPGDLARITGGKLELLDGEAPPAPPSLLALPEGAPAAIAPEAAAPAGGAPAVAGLLDVPAVPEATAPAAAVVGEVRKVKRVQPAQIEKLQTLGWIPVARPGVSIEPGPNPPAFGGGWVTDAGDLERRVVYRDAQGKPQGYLRFWLAEPGSKAINAPEGLNVYVAEGQRGQGIARKLYEAAQAQGYDVMSVSGSGAMTESGAALSQALRSRPAGTVRWADGATAVGRERLPDGVRSFTDRAGDVAPVIGELLGEAVDGSPKAKRGILYRVVDPEGAAAIKDRFGLSLEGYRHSVDNYALRHAWNQHGQAATELPRGQLPITADDVARIPEITQPENLRSVEKGKNRQKILIYELSDGDTLLAAEEVRTGRGELAFKTLYKRKAQGGTPATASPEGAAVSTPEASGGAPAPTANIARGGADVNAPELMTPEQFQQATDRAGDAVRRAEDAVKKAKRAPRSQDPAVNLRNMNKFFAAEEVLKTAEAELGKLGGRVVHFNHIQQALQDGRPVSVAAFDALAPRAGLALPDGYVKQGGVYSPQAVAVQGELLPPKAGMMRAPLKVRLGNVLDDAADRLAAADEKMTAAISQGGDAFQAAVDNVDVVSAQRALAQSLYDATVQAEIDAARKAAPARPLSAEGYKPSSQAMGIAAGADTLRQIQRLVAPETLLPVEFRTAARFSDQAQASINGRAMAVQRDLGRAMAGVRKAVPSVDRQVMDFMTGQLPLTALPRRVRYTAAAARGLVDDLSSRAIREGVVSGQLATTFADNLGTYLRRSYRLFADPDYIPDPATKVAAVNFVRNNWDPKKILTPAEGETIVNQLLDRPAAAQMMIGGKIAGRDVSSLIRRKDLAPEIRALYGEITDPIEAFGQTVPRLAKLIENHAAQQWIRLVGIKQGLFSTTADPIRHRQLVADASKPHEVWRGLYTTPELSDAMLREVKSGRGDGLAEGLWRMFRTASGLSKMSKTVLNPDSYAPNFAGGLVTMAANGNFNVLPMGRGLLLGAEELGALRAAGVLPQSRTGLQADIAKLAKLGLRGESVSGADLVRTWERSLLPQLTKKTGRVIAPWLKGYGAIDDLTKYMGWKSELARLQRAQPGLTLEAAERMAAERVRATMPTYSEIPKFVRELSQLGIAPSFVSFTWEVFRNTYNTARIASRDMAAGAKARNSAQVVDGARRMASLLAVVGASTGLGFALLSRRENGITDEQDEAVRFFGTPWNREAQLVYSGPVKDGRVQFANSSYLLPHALITQAIEAGAREKDDADAAKAFLNSFKEQFLSADGGVLIGPMAEAFIGYDRATGRPILNRESMTPTADALRFLYDRSFDPLVKKKLERVVMAARGEKGPSGRVYSLSEEAVRLAGVRQQAIDFNLAAEFKARELGRRFTEASNIYRSLRSTNAQPVALEAAYGASEKSRQRVFGEVLDYLRLTKAVGVSEDKAIKALRDGTGLPADVILAALDGRYVPQEREKPESMAASVERVGQLPAEEARRETIRLATENPAFLRALAESMRKKALGVTQRDELLMGLSVNDGARATYIKGKLLELPDAAARNGYIMELARKGIINERVVGQLVE